MQPLFLNGKWIPVIYTKLVSRDIYILFVRRKMEEFHDFY